MHNVKRYSVATVAVITFLTGLILGIWITRYGNPSSIFPSTFPQKEPGLIMGGDCPDGMRRHFNEMRGDYGCVPDDYIGI